MRSLCAKFQVYCLKTEEGDRGDRRKEVQTDMHMLVCNVVAALDLIVVLVSLLIIQQKMHIW